jgi:AcrR family transcriptional regulator
MGEAYLTGLISRAYSYRMPRPSQNLDRALLTAGRKLFPARGCAALSVREVAEAAGVNLGMFHYHFKTREAFLRAVMQQMYEEMFSRLTFEGARGSDPEGNLRAALGVIGRFVTANRPFIARLIADAISKDPVALEFARANMPRHLGVVHALIREAQKARILKPVSPTQALGFIAGSIAMPILFGGAVADSGALGPDATAELRETLLSDEAIDQRIDLALAALRTERKRPARSRGGAGRKK